MGVSAKQIGKLGSMLAKEKHLKELEHKDANKAKSKEKHRDKEE